ncbi:MAG: hypothetical protein JNK38_04780 [Acidobacteria bacterium]|nr:hypothetical protein [Acidobacteriota bacterium]
MPFQQMIAEMNALMEIMQLTLNILGIAVLAIFAVYLIGVAIFAVEKLLHQSQAKPSFNSMTLVKTQSANFLSLANNKRTL